MVPSLSTVREQVTKITLLEALAERAPIVYGKEWNFGRMVVKTGKGVFSHYDLMPTPSFCAIFQGTDEGVLKARKAVGTLAKTRCVRRGDDHCEYLVQW